MDLKTKKKSLYVIGLINFISAWCLTIGYFTRKWIYATKLDRKVITQQHDSCSIELIYTWCGHNYALMNNTLITLSEVLLIKYLTVAMIGLGIHFDLWKNTMFMTMLSILCDTFYPVAAINILLLTIYVEVYFVYLGFTFGYSHTVGYSAILCTVAGALMLIVFVCLVSFDQLYEREIRQVKEANERHYSQERQTITDSIHNGRSDSKRKAKKHKSVGQKIFKRRENDGGLRRL